MWRPRRTSARSSVEIATLSMRIGAHDIRTCKEEVVSPLNNSLYPGSFWDDRYGTDQYMYGTEPNDFLRQNIDSLPPGSVLCLADGEGRNSVFIASTGRAVWSVDLSTRGPQKAMRLAAERNVVIHAETADLATFDLGIDRWDAIVSIFAHMPQSVRIDLHTRVISALKPGGVFLLEAYTPSQVGRGTGGPQDASLTMQLHDLRTELSPLSFEFAQEIERNVVEGTGHTGKASVVQVIGRKN
jgi:SAM-dependent methyltransferase